MAIVEIMPGALWQADADPNIFAKLLDRGITPAMLIDLQELPARGIPLDGSVLYTHWPIEDGPVPNRHMLWAIERAACAFVESGGRVVTMCAQGRNRSGLISALIVSRIRGCSGADAIAHVRSKVPEALTNDEFVVWLRSR